VIWWVGIVMALTDEGWIRLLHQFSTRCVYERALLRFGIECTH
jgi:hypothetical protein